MKIAKFVLPVIAAGFASTAMAATSSVSVDATNTVAGVVANAIFADGQGADWTGLVLRLDLTQGTVYNAPAFDGASQQAGFWALVPGLQWDTAVGIANDSTGGIAGGAGDLGGAGGANSIGLTGQGNTNISVTWFNTSTTNTSLVQIGNISLSDDAVGTWSAIAAFSGNLLVRTEGGIVDNGAMVLIPEPASLALLGLGGLAALRRR